MAKAPKKVSDRLSKKVGSFQKVLSDAKHRDVNESDTVTIVTDMLASVFGYDKYADITSEQAIRGTYCDLAVKQDGTIKFLIEVKAIGLNLRENHLRQAVNYGANQGIPWIILTNGVIWEIYKLTFEQPISYDQVWTFDFLSLSPRKTSDHALLFPLCKEGLARAAIETFHDKMQVLNRFVVAALIESDSVLSVLKRELKRLAPEAKVSAEELSKLLPEVLKRDVIEGDAAKAARRKVARAASKPLRKKRQQKSASATQPLEVQPPTVETD